MEHLLYVDQAAHQFCLIHISWDSIQHERVNVRFVFSVQNLGRRFWISCRILENRARDKIVPGSEGLELRRVPVGPTIQTGKTTCRRMGRVAPPPSLRSGATLLNYLLAGMVSTNRILFTLSVGRFLLGKLDLLGEFVTIPGFTRISP